MQPQANANSSTEHGSQIQTISPADAGPVKQGTLHHKVAEEAQNPLV